MKSAFFAILRDWPSQITSNFVKMSDFIRIYNFWKIFKVLVCKIHIFRWSVKYTLQLFHISRTTSAFDLKFWPVIDIDDIRPHTKFQVDHVTGWYFTDRSVNYLLSAILSDLVIQSTWNFHQMYKLIKQTSIQNYKSITWLGHILQTRKYPGL